jgi:hypothetical protein
LLIEGPKIAWHIVVTNRFDHLHAHLWTLWDTVGCSSAQGWESNMSQRIVKNSQNISNYWNMEGTAGCSPLLGMTVWLCLRGCWRSVCFIRTKCCWMFQSTLQWRTHNWKILLQRCKSIV